MKSNRLQLLREAMHRDNIDALLLSDRKNIFYYSGFAGDDSYLLITAADLFLLSDGRFIAQAAAEAPEATMLCRKAGEGLAELLLRALHGKDNLRQIAFEGNNLRYTSWLALSARLAQAMPGAELLDCGDLPLIPRLIKDDYETDCLRICGELADKALHTLLPQLKCGMSEKEIAWRLEVALHEAGADGISFPTIAAGGVNSAKPHAIPSDYCLKNGDFLTLDFGALYKGYCGDCTRTFAFGEPTEEMLSAYQTVQAAQQLGVDNITPNMTCAAADRLVRTPIEEAGLGEYFSHSLGHGVGLNIHEAPTLSPAAQGTLAVGNIVTVEPGVYLPDKFGLRIEDSCLVTEHGLEPLTHFDKNLICL